MIMIREDDENLIGRLGENAEPVRDPLNTWLSSRQNILDAAEDVSKRIIEAYRDRSSTILKLALLSVVALGDYLSQAVADVARERGVDDDARSTIWILPESVCQPLFDKMHGWCPNRLHGLLNTPTCTVGVLWYIANLKPPKVHDGHRTCTPERCNSLHVGQYDYRIQHVSKDCKCAFIGPLMEDMAGKVRRRSIALFNVQHDAAKVKVTIQDESEAGKYVAISHVWADGNGNLAANSLPVCVLERLQKDVDALGLSTSPASHTPIWMDTICLPRYPLDRRRKALVRLSDVFTKASGVLVLDSYLRALDYSNMPLCEILARVSISGWTSRLWTFSEGRLAQRIWFQFRDKAMDLYDLMSRWVEELTLDFPSNPLTTVSSDMTYFYSAITLLGSGQEEGQPLDFDEMKNALNSRQTSWPSDEALCLGAILQLDLSRIVDADDSKKMAAFWRQVEAVPVDLIFFECSPKLEDIGCRWAPATMLNGANPDLGLLSSDLGTYATPTKNGLEFTMYVTLIVSAIIPISNNARESASSKGNFINFCRQPLGSAAGGEFLLEDK